ncbi:hypothetical protein E3C22_16555 [Jiella endophytica]|uniref:Uncharacterized protein n=1 Tax=Jiella endophytica TaxID=2558362 RepID=A0A4Y8RGD4_9HYPH|nr:hypothetical protein [Jiella endophytica]TFF20520.1 hypothetical protein E3C22_16555 [Jiella endophytica]
MARRRKLRIVDLTAEKAAVIAAHLDLVGLTEGYELQSPCRFWERKDGSWTGRFVYTHPDDPKDRIVLTSKGLRFA